MSKSSRLVIRLLSTAPLLLLGSTVSADTWQQRASGPSARLLHTAVWTGTEMIVWGGADSVGALNDGQRYNPALNSWTAVTTSGAPSARSRHTAVWTGTKM